MRLRWRHEQHLDTAVGGQAGFLLLWLLCSLCCGVVHGQGVSADQQAALRKETEDLFYHGFENYMQHAFPEDELRPISCTPLTRDRENPAHVEVNDVLGNYSLTLIDSLSTLAILASTPTSSTRNKAWTLFQNGVRDFVLQYGDGSTTRAKRGLRASGFDLDSKVQVFETVIRGLGGLLSAHLFATGDLPIANYNPPQEQADYARIWHKGDFTGKPEGIKWANGFEYNGQLLRLALDLGNRLIPAFFTPTGMPYPRVNLRSGIPFYTNSPLNFESQDGQCDVKQSSTPEVTETCSAGAGSLVLEFTVLSRLTGDERFEQLAKRAFWAIWSRRSDIGLIGAGIDAENGRWIGSWTGVGAGIDSFFEYALKSHILLSRDVHPAYDVLGDLQDPRKLYQPLTAFEQSSDSFLEVWDLAHEAIQRHLYRGTNYQHPHYIQADMNTGAVRGFWMDALSAYYPGLLTLAGRVEEATTTHLLTTALWTRFSALPERWNIVTGGIEGGLGWWLGRPEFIESTYHLYRATEDPWYLYVGEMVLRDIKRRCWTKCGWSGIQNVLTGEKIDRMESFFLGETAKYLFLLFDPNHPLNHLDDSFVFSTEGHPLIIPRSTPRTAVRRTKASADFYMPAHTCPVKPATPPFSTSATAARGDIFHAAYLARLQLMPTRDTVETMLGDYAADHPSIHLSDIGSPSNYTYYPWTLPPSLIPFGARSSPMVTRPTFDISFPTLPNTGPSTAPLQRVKEGILINSIAGLRLNMIQDVPYVADDTNGDAYRIQGINNLALGKDEKVFLAKDTGQGVLNPTDPNFSRIRDSSMLDIVIELADGAESTNDTQWQDSLVWQLPQMELENNPEPVIKSAWNAILAQMSSILLDKPSEVVPTIPSLGSVTHPGSRYYIPAITSTGIGAAPLPDWMEAASPSASGISSMPLPWSTIYATDELCDHKLPLNVPRQHQILVVQRGGCSFSKKLANIPAYVPSSTSLQLVIVVNAATEDGTVDDLHIRPLLDQQQFTSGGLPRHNPIPMVMVGGGGNSYHALAKAAGVGIKRRYTMQAQNVPIVNLFII